VPSKFERLSVPPGCAPAVARRLRRGWAFAEPAARCFAVNDRVIVKAGRNVVDRRREYGFHSRGAHFYGNG
jgi:hypothetical protein